MAALQRLAVRGTPKATKRAARYTPAGGAERCGQCRHYAAPISCARIEGPVSAAGWCALYSEQVTWRPRAGQAAGLQVGAPPTLDLSFMAPGTLDPRITFTRAGALGTATYFDVAGVMQTAATNIPRWDYDPVTHALKGLLIEEQRTNLLLNSATLVTQSVTVTAQAYTLSFFGTGTITKSGTATGALVGTAAFPVRVSQTFTPTAGSLTLTVTGTVQSAQLEAGAFPTNYVPTTAAAATRALDSMTMSSSPWLTSLTAFSYAVEATQVVPGAAPIYMQLDDGTVNNRTQVGSDAGLSNIRYIQLYNTGGTTSNVVAAFAPGVPFKCGVSTQAGNHLCALNGASPFVGANTNPPPAGITTLRIGRPVAATQGAQWLRRARFWNRPMSAGELQSVTT